MNKQIITNLVCFQTNIPTSFVNKTISFLNDNMNPTLFISFLNNSVFPINKLNKKKFNQITFYEENEWILSLNSTFEQFTSKFDLLKQDFKYIFTLNNSLLNNINNLILIDLSIKTDYSLLEKIIYKKKDIKIIGILIVNLEKDNSNAFSQYNEIFKKYNGLVKIYNFANTNLEKIFNEIIN